jgi:cell division cycle 2-like protein
MRQECRSVDEYERICVISEGTYGVVYKARHKSTGQLVALKRIKVGT